MYKSFAKPAVGAVNLMVIAAILCSSPAVAQSLDVKNPSPLNVGLNRATIDSFGGEQFWSFIAKPGHFHLAFTLSGPQEGFSVGSKAGAGAVFAPKTPGATLVSKDLPNGAVFDGNVSQPTRVVIMIEPAKSPLVRQTNDYTLDLTGAAGSASSAGDAGAAAAAAVNAAGMGGGAPVAASGPSVVGVYNVGINGYGAAKFKADGSIATASGAKGTWEIFDADTRTYVVIIDSTRMTLTYQPGRGLVDNNGVLVFQQKR